MITYKEKINKLLAHRDEKMIKLRDRGMSIGDIAKNFGLTHEAIRKRLKKLENENPTMFDKRQK